MIASYNADSSIQGKSFPLSSLPKPLEAFTHEAGAAIGVEPAPIALAGLCCLAGCIGNSRVIEIKPHSDYRPASIWGMQLADISAKKSPIYRAATEHLKKKQKAAFALWEEELAQWDSIPRDQRNEPEPVCPQTLVDESTMEGLIWCLHQNRRGVIVIKEELAGWIAGLDKYRKGGKVGSGDAEQMLTIYDQDDITVNRKNSRPILIPNAHVSIFGNIQPAVYKDCFEGKLSQNGLLQRFLVCAPPRPLYRWSDQEVSPEKKEGLGHLYDQVLKLGSKDGNPVPISMGDEAKERWIDFVNTHGAAGDHLTGMDGAFHFKAEGHAARLALVVHCARYVDTSTAGVPARVDLQSINAGISLALWFLSEQQRLRTPPYVLILRLIEANNHRITPRELSQKSRAHQPVEVAEKTLREMERSELVESRTLNPPQGGRPSTKFIISKKGYELLAR